VALHDPDALGAERLPGDHVLVSPLVECENFAKYRPYHRTARTAYLSGLGRAITAPAIATMGRQSHDYANSDTAISEALPPAGRSISSTAWKFAGRRRLFSRYPNRPSACAIAPSDATLHLRSGDG
jgi:hypothetical protein